MRMLIIIAAVFLLTVAVAGFWLKRRVAAMAYGAKFLIIMQRLGQFSTDLKNHGSFTNDIQHFCDIYPFAETITLNGTQHRCTLAAKSPLFGDGGVMAITIDDTVVWIGDDGKATPFSGAHSVPNSDARATRKGALS